MFPWLLIEYEYNGGMPSSAEFPGLSSEAFQFLKKLAKNNDRDWFLPRKPIYEEQWQKPMTQLMAVLETEMKQNKIPLQRNPKAVLTRIYRDIRFSADKSPYQNFVSGALRRNGKKAAPGVLYVHMGANEQFAAVGFWQPERPALTNWRLHMHAEPKAFLTMLKQLKSKKLEIDPSHKLKRMPRGFESAEGSPIGEFLRFQSFVIMRPLTSSETLSPQLPKVITRFALDAKPLLDYGWSVPEQKTDFFEK